MPRDDRESRSTEAADDTGGRRDEVAAPRVGAASSRYEILGEHGRGGLGRVSRARDRELERDVAIKELIARGEVSEARFRREALITARLEHPGIVPLYEAGQWADGTPYYAMKLVAGRPLRALIAERATVAGRLELLHHVIAVADAIAYAHGRGIIHRDLKPANVIVGEFGETVVIDWGLAKELGASDDGAGEAAGAPSPEVASGDALTRTGMVLGTPAYMAPEQERGEAVDQRADVFAIGAMLWELCALAKVPPVDRAQRHVLLRRNGIDPDLITILDKCLDREATRRYADAAGLAADLKAFKAGARIAARSYSLPAMLGHWGRRNRRVALATLAVVLASIVGVVLYARDLATERRRVDAANQRVILENARALMTRDPTAAYELLETYRGDDTTSLAILRAEAVGRGVAVQHLRLDNVIALNVYPIIGGVIRDDKRGHLSKVTAFGTSYPLTTESSFGISAQAESSSIIAYQCKAYGICLLDPVAERDLKAPVGLTSHDEWRAAFDPGGTLLVALSTTQAIAWPLSRDGALPEVARVSLHAGASVAVPNATTAWVSDEDGVSVIDLAHRPAGIAHRLALPRGDLRATHRGDWIVLGARTGEIFVIDPAARVVVDRRSVCRGPVYAVPLEKADAIAYYCEAESAVSLWDRTRRELTPLGKGSRAFATSREDRYLYVGTATGEILIFDARARAVKKLLGHASLILGISAPSRWYPYLVTHDIYGSMRSWKIPETPIVDQLDVRSSWRTGLVALPEGAMLIEDASPMVWYPREGARVPLPSSVDVSGSYLYSRLSSSRYTARFGSDDVIRLWQFDQSWLYREIGTGLGVVRDVAFGADSNVFTIFTKDGRIVRWSLPARTYELLASIPEPLFDTRPCPGSERALLLDTTGTGWMFDGAAAIHWLGSNYEHAAIWACAPGGHWEAIAETTGNVYVRNLDTHQQLTASLGVARIVWAAFSADGREIAIVSDTDVLFRRLPDPDAMIGARELRPVSALPRAEIVRPEFVTYSPDNRWIAITADHGAVWFYRRPDAHWVFVSVGEASATRGQFTSDSARFFVKDAAGKAHVIDMDASVFH